MSFYNPFQNFYGYQNPYQNNSQPQLTNPVMLPQEHVDQVSGKEEAEKIQIGPNSDRLVMDKTAPIVWLCVSDGVGRVTATPYDITDHKEAAPPDMTGIEERLANVESAIKQLMEGGSHGKSNAGQANAAPTDRNAYGKRSADR